MPPEKERLVFRMLAYAWVLASFFFLFTGSASAASRQFVVLVDSSASRDAFQQSEALAFLKTIAHQLSFDDEIVVLRMQQKGPIDHNKTFIQKAPAPRGAHPNSLDYANLEDKKANIERLLPLIVGSGPKEPALHTDIFATLQLASEYIADNQGRQAILVILSDMLQSTPDIEMEGLRRMPKSNWIATQRARGLLPTLNGVCVNVVGGDTATAGGAVVRNFWMSYFHATGAVLPLKNYRAVAPTNPDTSCK